MAVGVFPRQTEDRLVLGGHLSGTISSRNTGRYKTSQHAEAWWSAVEQKQFIEARIAVVVQ